MFKIRKGKRSIHPKLLRSTPWSKKTLTQFFSGTKTIADIVFYKIDRDTSQVYLIEGIVTLVIISKPEKNRVKVFLDHEVLRKTLEYV